MSTLGLVGSGHIGGTVAYLATMGGWDVVLSNSRGPETLEPLVSELGPRARAATAAEAAAVGDIVVVTIPLRAYQSIPVEPLRGKVVIDTLNYYPGRDGQFPTLDDGSATSSQLVQEHLAGSMVVKCFNNIYFGHLRALARPSGAPDRTALPIAGDDASAKAAVTAFLDAVGYDAADGGTLADSWRQQPGTPVYGNPYMEEGADNMAMAPPHPASVATVAAALAAARR